MDLSFDQKSYTEIAELIHSDQSPVGIDAKKTHILILQKLIEIQQQLDRLEDKINAK